MKLKTGDNVDVWWGRGGAAKWWVGGEVTEVQSKVASVKFASKLYGSRWGKARKFKLNCIK
jgi:hypothetical protein